MIGETNEKVVRLTHLLIILYLYDMRLKSVTRVAIIIFLFSMSFDSGGQSSKGAANGFLILTGGDWVPEAVAKFVSLAGGPDATIIYIPTAASSIRLPSGFIFDPDSAAAIPAATAELNQIFKTTNIRILHTRDRKLADDKKFTDMIQRADGVWLGSGNSGRLVEAYLGTAAERPLDELLKRGKVIGGHSAGAIIQGSFIVRGRYDKPLLMPAGRTTGFGFLENVVINPHLTSAKRENELVDVLDANPGLLGIGLDDNAALFVSGNEFAVMGPGRAAVYDNMLHNGRWYYWLNAGDRFSLKERKIVNK